MQSAPRRPSRVPWPTRLVSLLTVVTACGAAAVEVGQHERERMARLAAVQSDPANRIAPFETDGCSGGLSTGWRWLAERVGKFRQLYGERPPWESCCVDHDRAYWRGETEDGYRKRVAADEALRVCVVATGERLSGELSQREGIDPEEVEERFRHVADAMHRAVRSGGGPCTSFPWRWGYGWPPCPSRTR